MLSRSELKKKAKIYVLDYVNDRCSNAAATGRLTNEIYLICDEYNARELNIPDWVYDALPSISHASLYNWRRLADKDPELLIRKHPKRETLLDRHPKVGYRILELAAQNLTAKEIQASLQQEFQGGISESTICRFLRGQGQPLKKRNRFGPWVNQRPVTSS